MLQVVGIGRGCNILAEDSRARRKGAKEDHDPLSLSLCVLRENCLLVAHRGVHRGDDRVSDSSLVELFNLSRRQVEINR